jgi:hypothetical protein
MEKSEIQQGLNRLRDWYTIEKDASDFPAYKGRGDFIYGKFIDNKFDLLDDELINEEIRLMEEGNKKGVSTNLERFENLKIEYQKRNLNRVQQKYLNFFFDSAAITQKGNIGSSLFTSMERFNNQSEDIWIENKQRVYFDPEEELKHKFKNITVKFGIRKDIYSSKQTTISYFKGLQFMQIESINDFKWQMNTLTRYFPDEFGKDSMKCAGAILDYTDEKTREKINLNLLALGCTNMDKTKQLMDSWAANGILGHLKELKVMRSRKESESMER